MNRFPAVAVTGGVGCGKSEVGRILAELGVEILDADAVSHDLLKCDGEVRNAVLSLFGAGIVNSQGDLDRKRIAAHVFADEKKRVALEAVLHPRIWSVICDWREEKRSSGPSAALIPLLYEAGLAEGWDSIWCVAASDEVVNERLRERGWSSEHIEQRRRAQWSLEEKVKRADVVIQNDGSREALRATVLESWNQFVKRSRDHGG
ncbi:MAG: dephospho-CoA kinase [Kiritimatiellae bacterium]|nr:dephospho-CoA kinase [Kiritimatiellia bacterium]